MDIPGTKPNLNNSLLVSTGVPSLDKVLGGGIPVGSISIIEEDNHGIFAKILLKYFVAEAIACGQHTFSIGLDQDPNDMLGNLPALSKEQPKEKVNHNDHKMKIAFRYQNLPTNEKEAQAVFGHYYDLSETMSLEDIDLNQHTHFNENDLQVDLLRNCSQSASLLFKNATFASVANRIIKAIRNHKFANDGNFANKNILRISIHQLGSIMWDDLSELSKFMYFLRCVVRNSFCVAMITLPTHLCEKLKKIYAATLTHSADIVLRLVSFSGTHYEKNKALSDYHGFFYIDKLAAINTLVSNHPGAVDYTFKLLRKKFCIEKFYLPAGIDLDLNDDTKKRNQILGGCGTSGASKTSLDF